GKTVEAFLPACSSFGQHKSASETRRFTLFAKPIGGRWRACCSEERQGPSRAWRPSCQWRGISSPIPGSRWYIRSLVCGRFARSCSTVHPALSFTAVAKVPTGRNLGGGEHARRDRAPHLCDVGSDRGHV